MIIELSLTELDQSKYQKQEIQTLHDWYDTKERRDLKWSKSLEGPNLYAPTITRK